RSRECASPRSSVRCPPGDLHKRGVRLDSRVFREERMNDRGQRCSAGGTSKGGRDHVTIPPHPEPSTAAIVRYGRAGRRRSQTYRPGFETAPKSVLSFANCCTHRGPRTSTL